MVRLGNKGGRKKHIPYRCKLSRCRIVAFPFFLSIIKKRAPVGDNPTIPVFLWNYFKALFINGNSSTVKAARKRAKLALVNRESYLPRNFRLLHCFSSSARFCRRHRAGRLGRDMKKINLSYSWVCFSFSFQRSFHSFQSGKCKGGNQPLRRHLSDADSHLDN